MATNHKPGCPAPAYFAGEEKRLFENRSISVTIGDIITTSIDGVQTKHGWGLISRNRRESKNNVYCFKYCPWCGAEVSDVQ
jgi:hypothetical protein